MLRMIIADDFFYDREDVKSCIDWQMVSVEIVGEAEDGLQALELIDKLQPDIVMTDIEMPKINGFELIQAIKEGYKDVHIVLMSCYNEFEYARKALNLDVFAYITKPFEGTSVYEVFKKLSDKIMKEKVLHAEREKLEQRIKDSLPLLKERFFRNILLGPDFSEESFWGQVENLGIPLNKGLYQLVLFELDDRNENSDFVSIDATQLLELQFANIFNECKANAHHLYENANVIRIDDMCFILMLNYKLHETLEDIEEEGFLFTSGVRERIIGLNMPGMTVVCGKVFNDISLLNTHFKSCMDALKHKFFIGKGQLIDLRELSDLKANISTDLNQLKNDVREVLFSNSENAIHCFMQNYFSMADATVTEDAVKNLSFGIVTCLQLILSEMDIKIDLFFTEESILWKKLTRFETILDIRQWITNILSMLQKSIRERTESKNRKIIESVMKYIGDNLNKELTVNIIAENVYFSPNYLNTLFLNEVGETIPDYITKARIEKAKKLLEDPKLKLYEIIDRVGYKHLPHFNNLFKKFTGISPKEYRELV